MRDLVREEIAAQAHTVVVKLGTRVLTTADGKLDDRRLDALVEEFRQVLESGRRLVVVSSGAVSAGLSQLGWSERPDDLAHLQAVAAVGQAKLIESYDRRSRRHGRHAAQVLLTAEDLYDRARYLNVRNTLIALLKLGVVPIINENDTVAVDELLNAFGDNDRLAALVTNLLAAPLLIVLSDVDGLYDGDPQDPVSTVIDTVSQLDDQITSLAQDRRSGLSRGGMASKLEAARMATTVGENVIIANGHRSGVLLEILEGHRVGTLFLAQGKAVSPWKRWIGFSAQSHGRLTLDAGARHAIENSGGSLLAIGVQACHGAFSKGDVVCLCDEASQEFARGLINYSAAEMEKIKGLRSDRIAGVLGHLPYVEVMHRDNIVLTHVAS